MGAASQETVPDPNHPDPDGWQHFWDVSDGVRALKMAARPEFYPNYKEERRLAFAREHWPFFYHNSDMTRYINYYIDVLWPRIDEFVQMHEDQKANDWFAAGRAMQVALRKAKLKAPEWPIPQPQKSEPKPQSGFSRDLDDEIPF